MNDILFARTAIIGLGQMGASLGLALKKGGHVDYITGFDPHAPHASGALEKDAINDIATTLEDCVKDADLIILCTPVGAYASIMQNIAPYLKDGATLSDIGSIKAQAIRDIQPHVPSGVHFVPSHPIAGSEKTGPGHAHAEFFEKHLFLITPLDNNTITPAIQNIERLWISCGATVDILDPALHDTIYATMSHLPQFIAFAAADVLHHYGVHATDDDIIFNRFIRISRSDPQMWHDVFLENRDNVLGTLSIFVELLKHMRHELTQGDPEEKTEQDMMLCGKTLFPQLIASALATTTQIAEQQLERRLAIYAAGGFNDVLAPATDAAEPNLQGMSEQAPTLAKMLEIFLNACQQIRVPLELEDDGTVFAALESSQAHAMEIAKPRHEA